MIPGLPAGEGCPCLGIRKGISRKEVISMINKYSVGLKALKQNSAEPPQALKSLLKSQMPSFFNKVRVWGKKWRKPNCKHPKNVPDFFLDVDIMTLGCFCPLRFIMFVFLVLQRAVHHYSRPWPYFHIAAELARKGHQGKLLLIYTL